MILNQYDRFVVSRSDDYCKCPHDLSVMIDCGYPLMHTGVASMIGTSLQVVKISCPLSILLHPSLIILDRFSRVSTPFPVDSPTLNRSWEPCGRVMDYMLPNFRVHSSFVPTRSWRTRRDGMSTQDSCPKDIWKRNQQSISMLYRTAMH